MAGGIAVVCTSLAAGLIVFVALVTPGWFGLDIKSSDTDVSVDFSIFYAKVCVRGDADVHVCTSVSTTGARTQHGLDSGPSRLTEYVLEGTGALVCLIIGGILTIIFGLSVRKRNDGGTSYNGVGSAGLVFNILGIICAGILTVEFIIAHVQFDEVSAYLDGSAQTQIEKAFPYSVLLMGIGLAMEIVACIVQTAAMRVSYRYGATGFVLTPAVNNPSLVIQQSSTVSSTPYARFA